jgi:hypothetical protein
MLICFQYIWLNFKLFDLLKTIFLGRGSILLRSGPQPSTVVHIIFLSSQAIAYEYRQTDRKWTFSSQHPLHPSFILGLFLQTLQMW